MSSRDMPAKHAARPTAIQAHHGIWRDRSADRHRWSSLDYGFCCRFTKTNESLVDSRNQGAELIGPDLITSQIGADDLHGEFSVGRCGRRFVGHFLRLPTQTASLPYAVGSRRRFRISIFITSILNHTLWYSPRLGKTPPSFLHEFVLGGKREDLRRRFSTQPPRVLRFRRECTDRTVRHQTVGFGARSADGACAACLSR